MFFKKDKIKTAYKLIQEVDLVLVGAGAGFSAAAGLTYGGSRFENLFADYIKRYGMTDMYSAGFYPFATAEEKWGYWAKHIYHNRYEAGAQPLYEELYQLLKDKNYFVITTNVDGQFMKAGFDEQRYFEVQGNYGQWQCSKPCHDGIYDNQAQIMDMLAAIKDCKIPRNLIPHCPRCGAEMANHLRADDRFVQDKNWYEQHQRYAGFLKQLLDKKVVLLEIGVGFNTPTIIRYPFEQLTAGLDQVHLIRLNRDDDQVLDQNKKKTITIKTDLVEVFGQWKSLSENA